MIILRRRSYPLCRPPGSDSKDTDTIARADYDLLRRIPRLKRHTSHCPLPTRRTIRGRGPPSQTRNRRRALVHRAALLLGRHARLLRSVLGLHVRTGRLLRGR